MFRIQKQLKFENLLFPAKKIFFFWETQMVYLIKWKIVFMQHIAKYVTHHNHWIQYIHNNTLTNVSLNVTWYTIVIELLCCCWLLGFYHIHVLCIGRYSFCKEATCHYKLVFIRVCVLFLFLSFVHCWFSLFLISHNIYHYFFLLYIAHAKYIQSKMNNC